VLFHVCPNCTPLFSANKVILSTPLSLPTPYRSDFDLQNTLCFTVCFAYVASLFLFLKHYETQVGFFVKNFTLIPADDKF